MYDGGVVGQSSNTLRPLNDSYLHGLQLCELALVAADDGSIIEIEKYRLNFIVSKFSSFCNLHPEYRITPNISVENELLTVYNDTLIIFRGLIGEVHVIDANRGTYEGHSISSNLSIEAKPVRS